MKAVIYARYSSDSQREESIEDQIRECTAFAEKNGITILRHYIDRAYSAKTDNRPDFQEMIKDSGKKLFDMVIVWKLDTGRIRDFHPIERALTGHTRNCHREPVFRFAVTDFCNKAFYLVPKIRSPASPRPGTM